MTNSATVPRNEIFMARHRQCLCSCCIRRLLHEAGPLGLRRFLFLRRGRDHERGPDVPAVWAMLGVKFLVAFEVHVALIVVADLEDVADLRSDADDPRFEAADPVATP